MDVYVIVGEQYSGKSSVTRCLTGSARSRTRLITTTSNSVRVYVHLISLQEERTTPEEFESKVSQEDCDAVLLSLRPGPARGCPDADTYLGHFIGLGWNIVRVAFLGVPVSSVTTTLNGAAIHAPFPTVGSTPVNEVAAHVRQHFGWV